MPRVVIYARFSTDRQDKVTNESQVAQCIDYATERGFAVVGTFQDEATSGTNFKSRPAFQEALETFRLGRADILLCTSPDRLSRDVEHTERILKYFEHNGLQIHFAQNKGAMTALEIRLRAVLSAEMISDIRVKTREGQKTHFKKGKIVAGLSYGYRLGTQHDAIGDRIKGLREIDPEQAQVVRFIFDSYIRGEAPAAIAKALNAQGVFGPRGGLWRDTTIRGHQKRGSGIINNEMYIGRLVYNRQRWSKDPETENRIARFNDPGEWLTRDDESLRIIDDVTWYECKAKQQTLTRTMSSEAGNRLQGSARAKYMFSGMIECGVCGNRYSIIGKDRYGCSNHRDGLGCENAKTISRIKLEQRINASIPNALMSITSLEEMQGFVQRQRDAVRKDMEKAESKRKRDLFKLEGELANLIDAIKAVGMSPSIQAALNEAEARKLQLQQPLESPPERQAARGQLTIDAPIMNAVLRALAANAVHTGRHEQAATAGKEWAQLVQSLIDKIVVKPNGSEVLLEVHGQAPALLAAMKAWEAEENYVREKWTQRYDSSRNLMFVGNGEERAAFLKKLNEEIKKRKRSFERFQFRVVAGAGFEPATFRL